MEAFNNGLPKVSAFCAEHDLRRERWLTNWTGWAVKQLRKRGVKPADIEFSVTNDGKEGRPYRIHATALRMD